MGRFHRPLVLSLSLAILSLGSPAGAQIITFDAVPSSANPVITTLTTQGFTFTSDHFHTIDTPLGPDNGTIHIAEEGGSLGQPITMMEEAGGPFALMGFDASWVFASPVAGFPNATFIDVLGTLSGGGSLFTSFALAGSFTTFTLPGIWNNLTAVRFSGSIPGGSDNAGISLDNIVVGDVTSTVPEPGTVILLGTGLVGLAVTVRRRRDA